MLCCLSWDVSAIPDLGGELQIGRQHLYISLKTCICLFDSLYPQDTLKTNQLFQCPCGQSLFSKEFDQSKSQLGEYSCKVRRWTPDSGKMPGSEGNHMVTTTVRISGSNMKIY